MHVGMENLTPQMRRDWIEHAQLSATRCAFTLNKSVNLEIAMQGGSALRLCYLAPRFSMDLDFVVNESQITHLPQLMRAIQLATAKDFETHFGAGHRVRLKGGKKEDKKLIRYTLTVEKPGYIRGATNVNLEFWPVSPEYMKNYARSHTLPKSGLTITHADELAISTPTLKSIYIDKVLALSGRDHIKWRDIYDVWWISSKLRNWLPCPENATEMTAMFFTQAGAYDVADPVLALEGLKRFIDRDDEALANQASEEMGQFLDKELFEKIFLPAQGVYHMITRAKAACQVVHDNLERHAYGSPCLTQEQILHAPRKSIALSM